jgi:hypothetical protein
MASPDKTVPNQQAQTLQETEKATPEAKQSQSGGPYDLKTIEESYRSLYGS